MGLLKVFLVHQPWLYETILNLIGGPPSQPPPYSAEMLQTLQPLLMASTCLQTLHMDVLAPVTRLSFGTKLKLRTDEP